MANKRVIEVMFSSNLPQQARQFYTQLKKVNPQKAQQYLNSIFTEYNKGIKNGVVGTVSALGLGNIANAAEKVGQTANSAAEMFIPFYSATKRQLQAVNDYLDGKIDKDEYYKQVGSGTLGQALDAALLFVGGKAARAVAKKALKPIINKAVQAASTSGVKAATNIISSGLAQARNAAVKASPKAAEAINKGVTSLKGSIDDVLSKFSPKGDTVDLTKMSPEQVDKFFMDNFDTISLAEAEKLGVIKPNLDASFKSILRENAAGLKGLADQVGVKSAKELPNLIKFAKQLGSIIENSPAYIKSMATGDMGSKAGIIANTGLSVYDLYQAFKDGGNDLVPKTIGDVTRVGTSAIPGGFITKLLYGALGYSVGDKLSRAALKKLGVKQSTSDIENKEIEQGIRQPGLSEQIPEFITGQSGRKYHVVNDKIYDFGTGRPVNVQQALQDADAYIQFQTQQVNDQLANVNQQIADAENAIDRGYNISPDQLEPLYVERENLQTEANQLQQINFSEPEYDADGDLVEQVKTRVVQPQQDQQIAQQAQQQFDYSQAYQQLYNKIAQDTFNDLNTYYTPENQAVDYYQYMLKFANKEVPYMSPEQFSQYSKVQAMRQMAPQIQTNAQNMLNNLIEQRNKEREYQLNLRKQSEVERAGYAGNLIDAYKAEETKRHNITTEGTDVYKAQSGRMSATADVSNAQTRQQELGVKQKQLEVNQQEQQRRQQLLPYQQAEAAGSALMNAQMGGVDLDTFLNTNQSVMQQVYPAAFQQNQQQQQQPQVNSSPGLVQQAIDWFRGLQQ